MLNSYFKGEEFGDLLFAKFPYAGAAEAAVTVFQAKAPTFKDNMVWCNIDRPFSVRTPLRMLFGIKKLLGKKWGLMKGAIRIDESTGTMKVGDKPVIKVSAQEETPKIEWLSSEWESWQELQDAADLRSW